jgi:hypothetical protein
LRGAHELPPPAEALDPKQFRRLKVGLAIVAEFAAAIILIARQNANFRLPAQSRAGLGV